MLKEKTFDEGTPSAEWTIKRCGFEPDRLVRLVGSTMGEHAKHKQRALEKAKAFQGPDTAPPLKLIREKQNPHDPGAIAVYIGIDLSLVEKERKWTYAHVGYIPKGYRLRLRKRDGTWAANRPGEDDGYLLWWVLDELEAGRLPGKLLAGVNFVAKAPGTTSWGCEIGLRHDIPSN